MAVERARAALRRAVPGIAWRDERLAERAAQVEELRRRLRQVEQQLARQQEPRRDATRPGRSTAPSFRQHVHELRRGVEELRALDPGAGHPLLQVARKLRNHRLAASHGVPVPEVLSVWRAADQIDLSGLPDEFVLKSDGGAGGHGVLPLRRVAPDRYRLVGGGGDRAEEDDAPDLSGADVVEHYRTASRVEGPFFAEAMLVRPGVEGLPDDIKVYAFYGEVGQVLLRRMDVHADLSKARYRFLGGDGADLGPDASTTHRIDPSIPAPDDLETYLDLARHLSRAMALPFVRVDLYETAAGPVLGELTRGPGGAQLYRKDHDAAMGLRWERAQYRLDLDVLAGRPLANLHGEHPAVDHYPQGHPSQAAGWPVVTAPCARWCGAVPAPV
ncbi:ATP-grasp fold amidoligase family protein [Ornithinimicrobium avium]|nr:ATP-grasp fold amidoligase family protein [Ornithinimicrobium avium]